ncbi:MAG TPA: LamG domain-containing protein, partial [Candidatus Hydrothermia bacterium]|nr:LamG domain-containing protein [Candidatus Hydrothermia bacterium]
NGVPRFYVNNCIRFKEWQHVAATFDSTLASNNIKAYVNGELVGQTKYTTPILSNSKPIFIGSRNGVAGQFKGYMRNVRLYNTALSNEEIVDEMNRDYISPVETYTVEHSSITGTEEPPMQLAYY